jgi:CBS-domain-containing membrane protein
VTDSLNRHEPIVLTQTDLLRYIHAHFNELVLGFDPNATLDTWHHLRNDGVVSVTMEATALDAFKLLMEKKLSAVAIVRSDGTLAGTFSHSDLRGMTSKNLSNLSSPVMEYLKVSFTIQLT